LGPFVKSRKAELAYIEGLNAIAQKEGNAKKPIYQMHKGWARRLGSVFRMLILAAFAKENIHPTGRVSVGDE